ncbi:MAG: hypothetical protein PHG06_22700, partial [Parabacteroides sp.]|nr:hypothetical protein [Parabacteroides sp.]
MKEKSKNKQYAPIVFMNTPISDDKEDIIGINSAITAIKHAASIGAKRIGVIADYGTGKSSLTEILGRDKKQFNKTSTINMWDTLSKEALQINPSQDTISELTKSFLFQLASGIKDRNVAKHVNRRLSKNYGIISFSISSRIFWLWGILAAFAYVLFLILSNIEVDTISSLIKSISDSITQNTLLWLTNLVKHSAPFFLIAGVAFAVFGLGSTCIAFSHWKAQNVREPEVNDVFETYSYVYRKLLCYTKHRLVIIEDLDRISSKDIVVGFLKEIYRLENLSQKTKKKCPIFIISARPESQLINFADINDNLPSKVGEDDVYSKLFDYTVKLKPIHYEDYGDIVLKIIGDKNSLRRLSLQNILEENDRIKDDTLPESFSWIIAGHNLTIRQLKDRLNSAVTLLITLKNKNYTNQPYINFSSCAAVAYLESQYPKNYSQLIKKEASFSVLIQKVPSIRNLTYVENKDLKMKKEVDALFNDAGLDTIENTTMISDIVKMLLNGDISDDFRMFFYSYPKGSYIRNGDERDVSNLLLLPNDFPGDDKLDEKIDRIVAKQKGSTICEILTQISNSTQHEAYPQIIVQ